MLELLAGGGGTGSYLQVTYVAWEKELSHEPIVRWVGWKGEVHENVYRSGIEVR
jgi:hypothetical protein